MAFDNLLSFQGFAESVQSKSRFIFRQDQRSFLSDLLELCRHKEILLQAGTKLWRAQSGTDSVWVVQGMIGDIEVDTETLIPYQSSRMVPRRFQAREGRVNSKGIPCLYLASSPDTAMSELREWIGSHVSLSEFELVADVSLVDCTGGYQKVPQGRASYTQDEINKIVWGTVCGAFSLPVSPTDDIAEYAPTQALAEFLRSKGYDGIRYDSRADAGGQSVALFDVEKAKPCAFFVRKVESVKYTFEPYDFGEGGQGVKAVEPTIEKERHYSSEEFRIIVDGVRRRYSELMSESDL